ncbi:AAA family ATPase [Noviherbaspirillum autotrophicum]|uniref:AAA family ATPase n=1 Tax=Noviherbaspirillum autotrophicum TaxID=709839 RepID=UPI0009FCF81E
MTKLVTPVPSSGINQSSNTAVSLANRPRIKEMHSEEYQEFERKHFNASQGGAFRQHGTGHDVFTYGDLTGMNFTRAPWLFEGLMRSNEVAMVYAATGVGKTWLTLSLAMIAAGGGQLLEWSNDSPCRVLYLDGEMDSKRSMTDVPCRIVSRVVSAITTESSGGRFSRAAAPRNHRP